MKNLTTEIAEIIAHHLDLYYPVAESVSEEIMVRLQEWKREGGLYEELEKVQCN